MSAEVHYKGRLVDSSFIRPQHPINLVLCLDGTQNEFGLLPFSNSLRFFQLLDKDDVRQISYYQPGVGVKFTSSVNQNVINGNLKTLGRQIDAVFAFTFELHVKAAYMFLMRYYQPEDRIYIIGFSRGSFAGRILAGMLESVGLLNKGLEEMVNTAWEIYCNWENSGQPNNEAFATNLVTEFRKTFCRTQVKIRFMGLFDSVNSVGLLKDKMFPYTSKSSIVEHVRHAVSIDERRGKFKQVLFEAFSYFPHLTDLEYEDCVDIDDNKSFVYTGNVYLNRLTDLIRKLLGRPPLNRRIDDDCTCQDIKEVWFPGNHGDVGGGWKPDEGTNQCLSNMSLRWMLSQAIEFGIIFRPRSIHDFDQSHPNLATFLSYNHDILSLKHQRDMNHDRYLKLPSYPIIGSKGNGASSIFQVLFWWAIELLPIGIKVEDENGQWKNIYIPNLGRNRKMPPNASLHWSVFYRLHYFKDYMPGNLPDDLGPKFLSSIGFSSLAATPEYQHFAENLTIEKIKNDWNSNVWQTLPDELQEILKENPDI
ncbi:hypothetical protein CLIB1444_04S08218 [[Candida] jaroonii]|uniref:Uncharacterized protein n=1 Tax=[Candida] jaroonii TaxID=467808 RepID=A0ACA9Y7R0_9ASCO|nr:hypothetical protein CLIB1444_04S08218 [[Candida] jaroonii]